MSRGRTRQRHDVVFYTPWVGSILSTTASLPPGGAETQVLALAKVLVRHGLSVAIIVYGRADELPKIVDGVSIVTRPPHRKRSRLIGKVVETCQIWRALRRAPSRTVVKRGAGIDLGLIAVYARITRRHLVFSTANVVDFDYCKLMPHRRDLLIYSLGVRLANAIVVQTEEQIELCKAKFGRNPTLIKSISATAEPQCGMPEAFIWVGRLVSYKRPLEYIALARALPEAHFWMVGIPTPSSEDDKRLVDTVLAKAEELSNVELLPPQSHSEIEGLMSRAVASVNTADFEGMPNVLLEAWSRGVPALVLNHDPGGVIDTYGLGGFACGSHRALVALAREQWQTRNDRRHLSERCRSYVEAHHAPNMIAVRWLEILPDLAASGDIPSPGQGVELTCAE